MRGAETPEAEEQTEALLPGCRIKKDCADEREQTQQTERAVPDEGRRGDDDASSGHEPTMAGCPKVAEKILLYQVVGILRFGDDDQQHPLRRCQEGQHACGFEYARAVRPYAPLER